jgi:hypothetical protein
LLLQMADPITRGAGLFDPTTKLAICEFVILFSFLAFAQSIRMMNHLVSPPQPSSPPGKLHVTALLRTFLRWLRCCTSHSQ